jgi:hypothetical protein
MPKWQQTDNNQMAPQGAFIILYFIRLFRILHKYLRMSGPRKESSNETPKAVVLNESDEQRILRILNQTDEEKFLSFSKMLRRQIMLKQAKITHK